MRVKWVWICAIAVGVIAAPAALYALPMGTAFTYQGQLKDGGLPADGDYDFEFKLFDDATGGAQVGGDVQIEDWPVLDGLFTVQLDFGEGVFTGDALWLEVGVRPGVSGDPHTVLSPRQALAATPYALYALSGPGSGGFWAANGDDIYNTNSGQVGIGTTSPSYPLHVVSADADAVYGENTASSGVGVYGKASSFEGGGFGLRGDTYGTTGIGVFGIAAMTAGNNCGVYGQSQSQTGRGVYGLANNAAGVNYGVYGVSNSPDGWAGYFGGRGYFSGDVGIGTTAPAATLDVTNAGGQTAISGTSPWIGVYGIHNSTAGTFPGVWGETDSLATGAAGVRGIVTSTNPGSLSAGVYGINSGTGSNGVGVRGRHVGGGAGIYGTSELGDAGRFEITNAANDEAAVYATTNGTGYAGRFIYDNTGSAGTSILASSNGPNGSTALSGWGTGAANAVLGTALGTGRAGNFQIINGSSDTTALYCATTGTGLAFEANGTARVEVLEITGADLAEKFPVSEEVEPGMVVAIDPAHPGMLCLARGAYNRCVAGVVSGAGGLPTGVVLGRLPGHEDAPPIALSGRVWVYCDATGQPIEPGDLLTTSDTPGHAMKVTDHGKAQGAIIGKAMTGLEEGTGLVLVLVNLQ